MDEVICSKCGKANLLSDDKCHYCQAPLVKFKSEITTDPTEEQEIPEWLKRIRELKLLDEEREKEKEKWRQQALFGQSNEQQKQKNKIPEKKPESPKRVENPPIGQTKLTSDPQKPKIPEASTQLPQDNKEDKMKASGKDDLPEGFQPLSIDEDKP